MTWGFIQQRGFSELLCIERAMRESQKDEKKNWGEAFSVENQQGFIEGHKFNLC